MRVSKHWNPRRQTVGLRPSRIRRDPVPLRNQASLAKAVAGSREKEMWLGVAGILLFAVVLAATIIGISVATISRDDPQSHAALFSQCYNATSSNCVADGDTIYFGAEKVQIAGIAVPSIRDYACPEEQSRAINAALRLADLLNSGIVTVSAPFRDSGGRDVRSVRVDGNDVGQRLIDESLARSFDGGKQNWCS